MSWPTGIDVKTSLQVTAANEMFAFRAGRSRGADVYADFLIILVINARHDLRICCKMANT